MDLKETDVSFCITCKGRLHHLQQTLPENILYHRGVSGVEFVLLNYSSPDNLHEWVRSELAPVIEAGMLVYCKADGHQYYIPSHAKNVAHRLARGRILCNLDADNFTGPNFAGYLLSLFRDHSQIFFQPTGPAGVSGRIAMLKADFDKLGGYDERLQLGWGQDDRDLVRRALGIGLTRMDVPGGSEFTRVINHNDRDRTQYTQCVSKEESQAAHRKLSLDSLGRGNLIANAGRKWGAAKVEINFSTVLEI